jgi:hypothetical protein
MPSPLRERTHLRRFSQPWFFVSLVTLAIAISYFDRQALPVAISAIERTIPISDAHVAVLQASFLAAYALLYAGEGKFLDVIGTRAGFAISMAWWSLACALHGFAHGLGLLVLARLLLRMGEGAAFPAATRVIAEAARNQTRHCHGNYQCRDSGGFRAGSPSDPADSPGRKLALCLLLCRLPWHRLGHRLGGDIPATSEDRIRQSYSKHRVDSVAEAALVRQSNRHGGHRRESQALPATSD